MLENKYFFGDILLNFCLLFTQKKGIKRVLCFVERFKNGAKMTDDIAYTDYSDGTLNSILRDLPQLMNLHFGHLFDDIGEGEMRLNTNRFKIGFCTQKTGRA